MTEKHTITIKQLLAALANNQYAFQGNQDQGITNVTWDYKQVKEGSLYFCVEDEEFQEAHIVSNSFNYWADAVQAGAVCLLVKKGKITRFPPNVSLIEVEHVNRAMAYISREFYGDPLSDMRIIGITGTNGKTTTTQLLDSIFLNAERVSGVIGTIGIFSPSGKKRASHLSNPMATELFAIGHQMKQDNVDSLIMEITSHSMAFDRNEAIDFDIAVFTNLTQDHLDYHTTFENYKNEKLKHFGRLGSTSKKAYGIVNIDDATGSEFISAVDKKLLATDKVDILTYGIRNKDANLVAYPRQMTSSFSEFDVILRGNHLCSIYLPMPGLFNIYNSLAAFGAAFALGIGIDHIAEGLKKARQVEGRFEKVYCPSDFEIYVDYAHTPDALAKILEEIKSISRKRTIVVFGCGGDRDRPKRAEMGKIAANIADIYIITSDNPRTEDPEKINQDIIAGIPEEKRDNMIVELDRKKAIHMALEMAAPGDSVLIAGKGHETYQIIGKTVHLFSDRKVAQDFFYSRRNKFSRAWIRIDRNALRENFQLIFADKPKGLKVMAVVKDNALGHGIIELASEAQTAGCDYLGVACLPEGILLRQAGFDKIPILVFGERAEDEIPICVHHNMSIQIQSQATAEIISRYSQDLHRITSVHFKVDTGMGRYGVRWDQALEVYQSLLNLPGIRIKGIMTHFAQSDEANKDFANQQWERFQQVTNQLKELNILPPLVHACNTGGYLDLPHAHGNMVRLGALPLGVYPSKVCRRIHIDGKELKPVMSILTRIGFLKQLQPGDFVGYGMHFQAERETKVAVLPIGYGDGFSRLRNRGYVLIQGQEAPIIGGNSMDATMVDVSEIPNVQIGDEVVILGTQAGNEITAMMLADWADTVTYQITTNWSTRVDRVVVCS